MRGRISRRRKWMRRSHTFIRTFCGGRRRFYCITLSALPLVTLYIRLVNRTKFVNRKALRKIKGGCFLYGNHTHWSDAYLPHVAAAMKRTYVIAGPDAVSIKGIRNIVQMVGGIPIPTQAEGMLQFFKAVRQRSAEGGFIAIFPRGATSGHTIPASDRSRPRRSHTPPSSAYRRWAMVTVYRKSRLFKTPGRTVILSDPILPRAQAGRPGEPALFSSARVPVYGGKRGQAGQLCIRPLRTKIKIPRLSPGYHISVTSLIRRRRSGNRRFPSSPDRYRHLRARSR